ncbi:YDL086W-like protein [Saccharomyces cerevisiae x Saccharomyces kudriavzevii VIN7]|uniref:YDL086W-like protein n=1 Tax=Saccharomyces cerevisiae x Saccharomyces kudriavzevii (strain VIN7) TaxID=1095631 RepID=H0GSD3_SACCK|nr:YDL086W-like protein [Saccharomyces cerevisiae x Saccharomyces kudriavzevii VIN7]
MLITETFHDVQTSYGTTLRVYVYSPKIAGYPQAKFPGVILYSEIYQVTGPVRRFGQRIASEGYVVVAPAIYHNFMGPEALPYDVQGTDVGNEYKIKKPLESYDEDNKLCCDLLFQLLQFDGKKVGSTGMCLGGHLAFRALLDKRVSCATCFFPTDIHSRTLGLGQNDNTLERVSKELRNTQEMVLIFGTSDTHVDPEGRDLIRKTLRDHGVHFTFLEVLAAQHAFIRDEFSKGRFDSAITQSCLGFLFEQFNRKLRTDLGEFVDDNTPLDHVTYAEY